VIDMSYMFFNDISLASLDLTNWDTDPAPSSTNWIFRMWGTILCNDPDNGGTGTSGTGTVNEEACN
jgi:surface protein